MPTAADLFPVQLEPPAAMFAAVDMAPGTDITVGGPNGLDEVLGYFVQWGACIEGHDGCWTAPRSPSNYQGFHQGHVITADGGRVNVGMIGSKGHAPPGATVEEAAAFYQYPEWAKMRVAIYEDEIGAYVHGQLMPGVTYADVEMIRAAALSGHWQYREKMPLVTGGFGSGMDCLGPCLVSRPGFPLAERSQFALTAAVSAPNGTVEVIHSTIVEAEPVTNPPSISPQSFTLDGLQYTRGVDGRYDVTTANADRSCKSCDCDKAAQEPTPEPTATAAASSLETAANQADLDALAERVDELEAAFTRAEGDRMNADDMALEDETANAA